VILKKLKEEVWHHLGDLVRDHVGFDSCCGHGRCWLLVPFLERVNEAKLCVTIFFHLNKLLFSRTLTSTLSLCCFAFEYTTTVLRIKERSILCHCRKSVLFFLPEKKTYTGVFAGELNCIQRH
jgi:hypothetical protein